jgi:hypothetical protein
MPSQFSDIQDWASVGGTEGNLVESETEIQDYVEGFVSGLGTIVADTSEIPGTATSRARGGFSDYNDLHRYLETGGLTISDGAGGFIPNPIVYINRIYLDDDHIIYEVWIDDNT